jgi:hypothetical protein
MTLGSHSPAPHFGTRSYRAALTALSLLAMVACGGAVFDPTPGDTGKNPSGGAAGQGSGGAGGAGTAGTLGGGGATAGKGGSPEPVGCPVGQPQNGSTCANEGQTCDYVPSSCAACRCAYHCWNGAWVEDGSGCTPPPPPPIEACPPDRPKDGTYCAAAPPTGCTYVAAYCMDKPSGWTTYDCIENLWKAGQSTLEPCNVAPIRDAGVDALRFDAMRGADRDFVDVVVTPDARPEGSFTNEAGSP